MSCQRSYGSKLHFKLSGKLAGAVLVPVSPAYEKSKEIGQHNIVLNNITKCTCLYTKVIIQEVCTQALIDSGSAASILSNKLARKIGIKNEDLQKVSHTLTAANGGNLHVFGKINLNFEIDNEVFSCDFLVAELENDLPALLGSDFLEDFDVNLKFGKACMIIGKHKIKLCRQESNKLARIKLDTSTTIPADSEITVTAKVDGVFFDTQGVVEPYKVLLKKGVLMAKALVTTDQKSIPVSLINITNQNIKVDRNLTIGSLQAVLSVSEVPIEVKLDSESNDLPSHLQPLIEESSGNLNTEQSQKLGSLIYEFKDIFSDDTEKVTQTDLVEHHIDVGDSKPIKVPPRTVPLAQKHIIEEEVHKMLEKDIIEPSSSAWAAPVVLIKKKDNSIRFCLDYRRLNDVTHKDAYPLPKINDALDSLSGAKYFCTLDLASGYWQVKMHPDSKPLTAFSTHIGHFQFKVMPFGLSNAPATFERLIELVLRGMQWKKCLR
jgi:hypothetical protein